jgi:hypothetical protein
VNNVIAYLRDTLNHAVSREDRGCIAESILTNPQDHIDALVEAGVLERKTGPVAGRSAHMAFYVVVAPHVHEWRVVALYPVEDEVGIACECGTRATQAVPNRLPIEVPR